MVKKMPGFELVKTLSKKSDFSTFSFRIKEDKVAIFDKINCGSTVLN